MTEPQGHPRKIGDVDSLLKLVISFPRELQRMGVVSARARIIALLERDHAEVHHAPSLVLWIVQLAQQSDGLVEPRFPLAVAAHLVGHGAQRVQHRSLPRLVFLALTKGEQLLVVGESGPQRILPARLFSGHFEIPSGFLLVVAQMEVIREQLTFALDLPGAVEDIFQRLAHPPVEFLTPPQQQVIVSHLLNQRIGKEVRRIAREGFRLDHVAALELGQQHA